MSQTGILIINLFSAPALLAIATFICGKILVASFPNFLERIKISQREPILGFVEQAFFILVFLHWRETFLNVFYIELQFSESLWLCYLVFPCFFACIIAFIIALIVHWKWNKSIKVMEKSEKEKETKDRINIDKVFRQVQ